MRQTYSQQPAAEGPGKAIRDKRDRELIHQFSENRDAELREQLIERFMPLARALAGRYSAGMEPFDDLLQVASEGLVKAVDRFDPDRDVNFSSYATPFILGTLKHHFRDNTQSMRMPRSLQEGIARVNSFAAAFRAEHGREPTIQEVAREARCSEETVLEALAADRSRTPISLDRPAAGDGEEDAQPFSETIPSHDLGFDAAEARFAASGVDLDPSEREALRLRYEEDMTQRQIGEEIGVSQMQVSRILRRALNKLLTAVQGGEEAEVGKAA
ncbi:MAG: sigma-70 family RNA polymerase sigma factor [Solirubrobacterales bacterium]